jgi:hypothetical protein
VKIISGNLVVCIFYAGVVDASVVPALSYYLFIDTYTHSSLPTASNMVLMSVLNNCLVSISNAEKRGKRQVLIRPSSKVVIKFLEVMMKHGK